MRKPITLVVSLLLCAAFAAGASPSSGTSPSAWTYVRTWGDVPGSGVGELAYPSGIAVSPDGESVFVADTQNDRIQVFTSRGTPVRQWAVTHPTSITATRARDLFTLEYGSSRAISRYSQKTGRRLDTWRPPHSEGLLAGLWSTAEIAASDVAGGPIYGLGFCPDGVTCREVSDFVTRWDASGRITGTWNIHEDFEDGVYATALATDRQGNFYVARKSHVDYSGELFKYNDGYEWIEKYGSNGRLVARTTNVPDDVAGDLAIQSLAVDPNTGDLLVESKRGIVFLPANLKPNNPAGYPTGIPSDPYSELAIDCHSNVYVLSRFSGGVAEYDPGTPESSCQAPAPLPAKAVMLAPPRLKTVGPHETAVVQPVACRVSCGGILKVVTNGPSPSIIAQVRFRLPAGGGSVVLPLTGHGQSLAAQGGVLNVSVTATIPGSSQPPTIVNGILKDPSTTRLICPPSPQTVDVPFQVGGSVSPPVAGAGRVAVAFAQSAATNSLGYLAGQWLPAAAAGSGRYTRVLVARAPGTWRVQMVSLGDQAHEGSHSGICSVNVVAPAAPAQLPSLSVSDGSVPEGNVGGSAASVTVALSAPSTGSVSVSYTTASGTATSGSDFAPASGRLTFPPGVLSQTVPVTVIGDTVAEPDETFTVQISNPANATISKGAGTVTIRNDDMPPTAAKTLTISDASVTEGNSGTTTMAFTVSLSPAGNSQVQVDFATKDGTASSGSDYKATNGTLTFAAGETSKQISVKVNGDTTVEPDEQFSVELSRASGATIGDGLGVGTIVNDDSAAPPPPPPPPPVSKPDLTVTAISRVSDSGVDSCTVQFTVKNIGNAPADSSTTNVHGHAGIAGNWNDYEETPSLAPGASVQQTGKIDHPCESTSITVTADTSGDVDESNEDNNSLGTSF